MTEIDTRDVVSLNLSFRGLLLFAEILPGKSYLLINEADHNGRSLKQPKRVWYTAMRVGPYPKMQWSDWDYFPITEAMLRSPLEFRAGFAECFSCVLCQPAKDLRAVAENLTSYCTRVEEVRP